MQNFQFEGILTARFLTSGANAPNGGWRSELQIYSFQIQNIQMSTIFSCTSITVKKKKKRKKTGLKAWWRHRFFLKLDIGLVGLQQVWPHRWLESWRDGVLAPPLQMCVVLICRVRQLTPTLPESSAENVVQTSELGSTPSPNTWM